MWRHLPPLWLRRWREVSSVEMAEGGEPAGGGKVHAPLEIGAPRPELWD